MICPICKGYAEERIADLAERRFFCSGCGEYRMSAAFEALIGDRSFDIDLTRAVLEQLRKQGLNSELEPLLVSTDEYLLLDPR